MHTTLTIHIFDILQVEAALGKTEDAIHNFEKVSILKKFPLFHYCRPEFDIKFDKSMHRLFQGYRLLYV